MSVKLKSKEERDTIKVPEILDNANPKHMTVNSVISSTPLTNETSVDD